MCIYNFLNFLLAGFWGFGVLAFSKSGSETGSGSDSEMSSGGINEDGTKEKPVDGAEGEDSDNNSQESAASRHPWEIKNEIMLTDADV